MVEDKKVFSKFLYPLLIAVTYLFLYMPIFVLVFFSFNDSPTFVRWAGFSLRWYKELLLTPEILQAAKTSLIVAFSTTFLSLMLGSCFVVSSKWWRTKFMFNLFYTNILLPEIVMGIGLLSVFSFFNLPLGYGSLIAGHTVLGLGFVVPILRARFNELDPVLTEASLDLGASYFQTFIKVIIPLMMPSLVASGLLVFTLSLDDFLISFFCCGPSIQPLSVYIYSMVKIGVHPTINAISAIFLAISSIFVLLLCALKVVDQVISYE